MAEPTTTPSASLATSAARSGVFTPKPTTTGKPEALRTLATWSVTDPACAKLAPVMPVIET